jgi:hypothetical protein
MLENSWAAERLAASQEGLSPMEIVTWLATINSSVMILKLARNQNYVRLDSKGP